MSRELIREAISRRDEGLFPLPLAYRAKHPRRGLRVAEWLSEPPTDRRLEAELRGHRNLGFMLGDVSAGGLTERDFDTRFAYREWKRRNPDLAAVAPTVETYKGFKVFVTTTTHEFASAGRGQIIPLEDGELRRQNWTVWPPSCHPLGTRYRWTQPPGDHGFPFVADLLGSGLLPAYARREASLTEPSLSGSAISPVFSPSGPVSPPAGEGRFSLVRTPPDLTVGKAIRATLPMGYGERHLRLFGFARLLMGMHGRESDPLDREGDVRRWHRAALPHIRTKSFGVTWREFLDGWKRIRVPHGGNLRAIAAEARGEGLAWLDDLCRLLARHNAPEPFFLAGQTAADLMKENGVASIGQRAADKWLKKLEAAGRIRPVERGRMVTRTATTYRYLGTA